jgi:Golgi nucleoside diphosphatase
MALPELTRELLAPEQIPEAAIKDTWVRLFATAGLRLLPVPPEPVRVHRACADAIARDRAGLTEALRPSRGAGRAAGGAAWGGAQDPECLAFHFQRVSNQHPEGFRGGAEAEAAEAEAGRDAQAAGREWVAIASGLDEAVDAWVTANYILETAANVPASETVGTLDLGGGSVQITCRPGEHGDELPAGQRVDFSLGSADISLYAHSHLAYGKSSLSFRVL